MTTTDGGPNEELKAKRGFIALSLSISGPDIAQFMDTFRHFLERRADLI